jgi:hypothetical protein
MPPLVRLVEHDGYRAVFVAAFRSKPGTSPRAAIPRGQVLGGLPSRFTSRRRRSRTAAHPVRHSLETIEPVSTSPPRSLLDFVRDHPNNPGWSPEAVGAYWSNMTLPDLEPCESPRDGVCSSSGALEPRPSVPCVRLVVVEDGANAAEDHAVPDGADDTVFIAQGGGERPMDFARRVIGRILAFEEGHRSIVSTIVLLSPRFDNEATAARIALAHELMRHAASALGSSELLLSAGSDLHPTLQSKVVALADLLMAGPGGNALLVTAQLVPSGEHQVRVILGGRTTTGHEDERPRCDPQVAGSSQATGGGEVP